MKKDKLTTYTIPQDELIDIIMASLVKKGTVTEEDIEKASIRATHANGDRLHKAIAMEIIIKSETETL